MLRKAAGRKVAGRYDVPFVGIDVVPITLGNSERAAIGRILKSKPSDEFIKQYSVFCALYIAHRKTVTRAAPAAVEKRLKAVLNAAVILQECLNDLELTDQVLIGQFETERFLRSEKYSGLNTTADTISEFLPMIEESLSLIRKEPKHGRMPAYAERVFVSNLYQILLEESGKELTFTQGGLFDKLVRCAFTHALNPRKDVTSLLRLCVGAPQIGLLQMFHTDR